MTLCAPICTCNEREHACSPPCPAHPERGGGLGNPGSPQDPLDDLLTPEARERFQAAQDAADDALVFGYRACGWPGCRKPKGHKGRCAPSAAGILGTPGVQVGKGSFLDEATVREAIKAVERQPLDLPGGPAPRTVPADPQSVEDERAVRAEFQRRVAAARLMERNPYPWLTIHADGSMEADLSGTPAEGDRRLVIMQELSAGRVVLPE